MITIRDHRQGHLFDPWDFLSPKRRKMLEEGWPALFSKEIPYQPPIERLRPFFCEDNGRPSKKLCTLLGAYTCSRPWTSAMKKPSSDRRLTFSAIRNDKRSESSSNKQFGDGHQDLVELLRKEASGVTQGDR